ncbi:LysR family transcriptional regulator [Streptomyces cavernicola]|uniref:LysR substrate-binding domain-containing protein n=1 Tax=Streptomyces cavernicola TaxID=3043613 RepID=A0ABT6SDG3_9ACTN|nr:LysR substrate-binding domain-containing protein [Streptomyces sp. B-S-A6]MDI3406210.1 LysR substrate-binding domain-containing protein [Streptomyces sp. B-S-A6]
MAIRGGDDAESVRERPASGGADPSTHQLRLFLTLAEELHFGRAAARLFITQPAFSQQIRSLERRLGLQLIDRTSRAVELTPAGRALLPRARAVTEAMAELRREAEARSRAVAERIVIGTLSAEPAMPHTHAILDELNKRQPGLTVEIRSLNFVNQYDALASGEVDAAFLRPPAPPGIQVLQLAEEPRVVCLPAEDPLAGEAEVRLDQLSGRPMVTMPPESPKEWRDYWAINPRPDGSPLHFGPLAVDVEGVLHAVSRRQAIGILPASARTFYPRPGIVYRDLTDAPSCTMALAWFAKNRDRADIALLRNIAHSVVHNTALQEETTALQEETPD